MASDESLIEGELSTKEKVKKEAIEFFRDLAIVVIIVFFIRSFIAEPFQISWQSMANSYYDKEFIIVDRFSYLDIPLLKEWNIARWDVVVFKPNVSKEKQYFIKRIIGLPGETLKISDWKVYVKKVWGTEFVELQENYLSEANKWLTFIRWSKAATEYNVPADSYFVMWDNRNASTDSRECFFSCMIEWHSNFIKSDDVTGKVFLDLWYFNFKSFSFTHPNLGISTTPRLLASPREYNY
jgi:signal peptidase I